MNKKKEERKVISIRRYKTGYEVRTELVKWDKEKIILKSAYTSNGDYIGNPRWAHRLYKKGIKPEKINPKSRICSIGFCEREQKWYGWSHRAICGFGIGSTCKKGDIHYRPKKGEWTAKTLSDAKQMAIDFAKAIG